MTERQLQTRVRYWQRQLPLLGLTHWRFAVTVTDDIDPVADDALMDLRPVALADADTFYDNAEIEVRRDVLQRPQQHIDELIVHELLHVVDRDRDNAENSLLDHLADDVREAKEARLRAGREKAIDRVARQIVALHG